MAYRKQAVRNYKLLNLKRKVRFWWIRASFALCFVIVFLFAYLFYFNQSLLPEFIAKKVEKLSQQLGYIVQEIEVVGEDDNCHVADVSMLDKYKGMSTILVSVDDIRKDLESVDCIGQVSVSRVLPSRLRVSIEPRMPIAIWQHKHKFFFIANNGSVLQIRNSKDVSKFIIILGDHAPEKTPELLKLLRSDPELYQKVVSAIWIGDRRWNVIFDNGMELLLPENDYIKAWNKFVELSKNNEAFKSFSYCVVDLRVQNRIYAK
jgi:cell division protein FtsQ